MVNTSTIEKTIKDIVREIKKIYSTKQNKIRLRLQDFKQTGNRKDDVIFTELVF